MPTKLGKGGAGPQNYVPKGNGDASGEYGDNASGSNKHIKFEKFGKPESIKITGGDEKSNFSDFNDYVENKFNGNKEGLKKSFEAGTDDSKNLLNYCIKNNKLVIIKENRRNVSNYDMLGGINLTDNVFNVSEYSSKVEGETLWHEAWHGFDDRFSKELLNDEDNKNFKNQPFKYQIESGKTLSTTKILSNGKTLDETIKSEITKNKRNNVFDLLKEQYYDELRNNTGKAIGIENIKEIKNELIDIETEINEKVQEKIPWSDNATINYNDWIKQRKEYEKSLQEENKRYKELEDIMRKYRKEEYKQTAILGRSYMSLSDIYGFAYNDGYGFCGGHGTSYYKRRCGKAHEFIAEYGSAISRTDEYSKKEIELFEKYFPESSKMCSELCNMILNYIKEE